MTDTPFFHADTVAISLLIAILPMALLIVSYNPQVRQQIEISGWMRLGLARYFNGLGCERR